MKNWYDNRYFQIALHLTAWTIFFAVPSLLRPDFQHEGNHIVRPPFFTAENLVTHGFLVILFYLNAYYLIPRFLSRQKLALYFLVLLLIFSATLLVTFKAKRIQEKRLYESEWQMPPLPARDSVLLRFHHLRGPGIRVPFTFSVFAVAFVLAVSTAYRFTVDRLQADKIDQLRQNERLKTELTFLRSQISPHFIFNILNSAVSLARTGSDQLEPTLLQLSNLLRYMLYNADDEKVPLVQELEYLRSYIDLQKLRFGEDLEVSFTREGNFMGYAIEPMLLIPFVENAFKHGVGSILNPAIFISIREEHGRLSFQVRNRFSSSSTDVKDKNSGIGLANVKKRLTLLYGVRYALEVKVEEDWFDVHLNLLLK